MDASPIVRAMAVWALSQLLPHDEFAALRERYLAHEADDAVKEEWNV
jgi:epoxyqueuosine reductase